MYEKLKGKKILILGANAETVSIVETAKLMGVITIVTDNVMDSPAKKVSDKHYDIDATDVDSLYAMAVEENISGVVVGVADSLIGSYQELCDKLNLPCYATAKTVKAFTNKREFKRLASKYGIQGVYEYSIDNRDEIEYPVIVKPTDNSASKGISLCHSDEDLDKAIEFACNSSRSGTYIIERYMQCCDVSIYYTIVEGKAYLSSISDRFTLKRHNATSICVGDVFPSKLYDEFMRYEHEKYCRMFEDMGVKNAIFYVSAFYENGHFYVYDPGFRLQGGGFHRILDAANGFDHRKMLINFALTGSMNCEDFIDKNDPLIHGKAAAVVWYLIKEGTIGNIEGLEYIKNSPYVTDSLQRFNLGDEVTSSMIGTERQVFLRVFLQCNNKSELKNIIQDFHNRLIVESTEKKNMLCPSIKPEDIEDTTTNLYLKNKTIVITGGTKGVGRELAKQCARLGANVVIAARDEESANRIKEETKFYSGKVFFKKTDLRDISQIRDMFNYVEKAFHKLDGFVNYAGITPAATLTECEETLFDEVFAVDIKAAFFCSQCAVKIMQNGNGGSIVLVGSTHHDRGNKDRAAYACAKGALLTLSNHIAKHYAENGIRCNYLTMGWTMTDGEIALREHLGESLDKVREEASEAIPLGRMTEYVDIVPGILYLISDNSLMLTGSEIRINGGELI